MRYVVYTYRPAYPDRGVKTGVAKAIDWPDCAPPTVTTAWLVENGRTVHEAIALVIEKGAGKPVTVERLIPAVESAPRAI